MRGTSLSALLGHQLTRRDEGEARVYLGKNAVVAQGLCGANARTGWQEREEALFFSAACSLFLFPYLSPSFQNQVTQMVEGISNQLTDLGFRV